MTMLTATSRMVVRNRMRSDLSFRAIRAYKAKPRTTRNTVSGQRSSVGLGKRHQLHRPGQPVFPAASPLPQRPTDDCSPLTVRWRTEEVRPTVGGPRGPPVFADFRRNGSSRPGLAMASTAPLLL